MCIERLPLMANGHLITRKNELTVTWLDDGLTPLVLDYGNCAVCDKRPKYRVTADRVEVLDPCPYPDGITTTITLSVPSGKIIVSDTLRPVYNWDDNTLASYNTVIGQAQAVEAMAAIGCAYGPVGNSSPGMYRTGPHTYIIASPGYDDDDNPMLPEENRLASICTDLWAYSIADFEHWKARGGNPDQLGWPGPTVVNIPPGTYRFQHHSGETGFERDAIETVIFAHVQRIGTDR